jgi:hypothetical protein
MIMDISSVISAATIQSGLYATNSTPSIASLLNTTATSALTSAVDISGLGQLLSASAIFESGLLKAVATNQANFSTVAAATQLFVQAFNNFVQSDTMQSSSAVSPAAVFMQVLNAPSSSASGQSVIASLATIGINYQVDASGNGQMSVDFAGLQSAFNSDQQGTVAVLAQTTQTVGQLASEFTSLFAQTDALLKNAQSTVNSATLNGLLEAAGSSAQVSVSAAGAMAGGQSAAATESAANGVAQAVGGSVAESAAAVFATEAAISTEAASTAAATGAATTSSTESAVSAESTAASIESAAISATAESAATVTSTDVSTTSTPLSSASAASTALSETIADSALVAANARLVAPESVGVAAEGVAATDNTPANGVVANGAAAHAVVAESASGVAAGVLTGQPVASAVTEVAQVATTVAASLAATPVSSALANPAIDISNPAIAAAIAAYHMVDGLFDSTWPHDEGATIVVKGYTEIWPVGEISAVRLDLYV